MPQREVSQPNALMGPQRKYKAPLMSRCVVFHIKMHKHFHDWRIW